MPEIREPKVNPIPPYKKTSSLDRRSPKCPNNTKKTAVVITPINTAQVAAPLVTWKPSLSCGNA